LKIELGHEVDMAFKARVNWQAPSRDVDGKERLKPYIHHFMEQGKCLFPMS